ncbi:Myosin-2 heavy chain-like protein [Quillaja saponaria]|uniref:Myosin-2 heavy chain-like protein n=1 Tax=Quillaja saponaria TaxID=32244 RepID=A0AAD7M0D0_QUISA|nr:Myosin-2 heavy chain-like protein [Quillaja saponaria]
MDLGCLDLGCISVLDKKSTEAVLDFDIKEDDSSEPVTASSKIGKNKLMKETSQSTLNALNKFTSQIKKPPHRRTSPLNWFPRKKVDSYLERKIKLLQEGHGMNLTLDETLGDSNPHYSRVLREKMAAKEAAHNAMEARRAALVEASWCKILRAARIPSKDAEALLLKAEQTAAEAFEAASAKGVIMYDKPNFPRKPCEIETYSVDRGGSSTHTVTASFETAFDIDKEVAAAVKTAFIRLASCPSFDKDEFRELLRKISQNPDAEESNQDFCQDLDSEMPLPEMRQRKNRRRQSADKFNMEKLVDMMTERLKCLHEDELSSLATIVATCGLNAALAEVQNIKLHNPDFATDCTSALTLNLPPSTSGSRNPKYHTDGQTRKKQVECDLPSLDKFLVKHMTKLEREVEAAKSSRKNELEVNGGNSDKSVNGTQSETIPNFGSVLVKHHSKFEKDIEEAKKKAVNDFEMGHKNFDNDITSSQAMPDLGSILIKHSSKLEKEIEVTKRNGGGNLDMTNRKGVRGVQKDVTEVPSLDKFLVKHVSRLEKEVQEAKNRRTSDANNEVSLKHDNLKKKIDLTAPVEQNPSSCSDEASTGKENINLNKKIDTNSDIEKNECMLDTGVNYVNGEIKEKEDSLDRILIKPVHRLEREKIQALALGNNREDYRQRKKQGGASVADCESLDKVLVKHVSRLEKEKMRFSSEEETVNVKRSNRNMHSETNEGGGLDHILVKPKSRLEREKMAAAQHPEDQIRPSVSRRETRERELQEAWGGLSLGKLHEASCL